ncbi:MAG: hypothetical protein JWO53_832 [Chlamydiia bacterium]|nr:hypothetical protein [Chlamydiia bacterium]
MSLINISNQLPYHFLAVTPPNILRSPSFAKRSRTIAIHAVLFIVDKIKETVRDVFIYLGITKSKEYFKFKEVPKALQAFTSGFLDPQSLLCLTSVSREFRSQRIGFLKGHSTAMKKLINHLERDLDKLSPEDRLILKNTIGPTIHQLSLSKVIGGRKGYTARSWTKREVEKIVQFFPRLTSIDFRLISPFSCLGFLSTSSMNDDDFLPFCTLPHLKKLDLTRGASWNDAQLCFIAEKLLQLEEIHLGHSPAITEVGIEAIIKGCTRLKRLVIGSKSYFNVVPVRVLRQIPKYLTQIECLVMSDNTPIDNETILCLLKGLPALQSLILRPCSYVTAAGLYTISQAIIENPLKLRELQLTGFDPQRVSGQICTEVEQRLRQPLQRVVIR